MAFNQPKPNLPYMTKQLVGISGGNASDKAVAKAIDALKSFVSGDRKTKPSKKMLQILEKHGVISKKEGGCSMPKVPPKIKNELAVMPVAKKITGGVNRYKKAERWSEFSKDQVKDGIDLAAYGYKTYNEAMNPMQTAAVNYLKSKTGGSVKRAPSEWIKFVKAYSQKHNIPYGEALKKAGPEYRKLTGKGYGSVGGGYKNVGGGYGAAS